MKLDHGIALSVAGVSVFQLVDMWNKQAPNLSDVRAAPPGDVAIAQRLMDADLLVGGLAFIVGVGVGYLSGNWAVSIMLILSFTMLSGWYHSVLAADSR